MTGPTPANAAAGVSKTPLFAALNAARYARQALIRAIDDRQPGQFLVTYVSNGAELVRADCLAVVDLLHNVPAGSSIDFLLHTPGGDIDAAEKLVQLFWDKVGQDGTLRVIVPQHAKSAGTLIAIGADTIVMGSTSELGPIDPQIAGDREGVTYSVQHYIAATENLRAQVNADPNDRAAEVLLAQIDPVKYEVAVSQRRRARQLAESNLKRGMFRRSPSTANVTEIGGKLLDSKTWLSHGQMIDRDTASSMGLDVTAMDSSDPEWQAWWALFLQQRLSLGEGQKLFESAIASIPL